MKSAEHPPPADAAVARFLTELYGRGLARTTIEDYRVDLDSLVAWMAREALTWPELTPARIGSYVDGVCRRQVRSGPRRGLPLHAGTIYGHVTRLRVFVRTLVADGVLLLDPVRNLVAPQSRALCGRGLFSESEVTRLLAAVDTAALLDLRDRAIVSVLYGTGLRRGELVALDLVDYDPDPGELVVRQGKGRRDRRVPVGPTVVADLTAYLTRARPQWVGRSGDVALFVTTRGRRLGPGGLDARLLLAQERAGITPRRRAHALRHACATHMLARGADVRSIQELLGHTSLDTTAQYTQVTLTDLRQVLARAHPREKRSW